MTGPLEGVRVIDASTLFAGPLATTFLGDFGADVTKIEHPARPDAARGHGQAKDGVNLWWKTLGRNKRTATIDLSSPDGGDLLVDLATDADVLVENFRPGTLERWGLDAAALEAANPDLVLVRISAFGQTGPLSPRPGFAAVAEAAGGFRELVGEPGRAPSRTGVSIGDTIAGLYGAFGAVMALLERETTRAARGEAHVAIDRRTIDVALNEAMLSVTESLVPEWSAYGVRRERTGGRMEGIAPSNAYLCADGRSIVVAGNGDGIYQRYMRAIGRPDLADDPTLQSNDGRWAARDALDEAIGAWAGARSSAEALVALDAADVPSGPIATAEDLCADEQLAARGMIQHLDVDDGERDLPATAFPGVVPVLGERSLPIRHAGPDLGAHTGEVLRELGWSDARVDDYEERMR